MVGLEIADAFENSENLLMVRGIDSEPPPRPQSANGISLEAARQMLDGAPVNVMFTDLAKPRGLSYEPGLLSAAMESTPAIRSQIKINIARI